MDTEKLVKVRFKLDSSDWHGHRTETLWAMPIPKSEWRLFKLRNSPYFATGINHLDVVAANPTENDRLFDFTEVAKRGGHATYMILMQPDDEQAAAYWKMLERMGCSYEARYIGLSIGRRLLYSVDAPPTADGQAVYDMLERGHDHGVWIFQTGDSDVPGAILSDDEP